MHHQELEELLHLLQDFKLTPTLVTREEARAAFMQSQTDDKRDSLERGVCAARGVFVVVCAAGVTLAMIGMFFVGCTVQARSLVRAPKWGRFNAVRDGTEASEALLEPASAPVPDLGNLALSRVSTR